MGCDDCCKKCCYSTPCATLIALSIIIVGLVGFIGSAIYGIVIVSINDTLTQHVTLFAPILFGIVVLTSIPLGLSTTMGYCVTGYIKDELFHGFVKKFIGPCCSFFSISLNISFFCFWLILTVLLSCVLTISIQLILSCSDLMADGSSSLTDLDCLPSYNYTFIQPICGSELQSLCNEGVNAGIAFAVCLFFSLFVVFGLMLTLMVQNGNYINARENMEYRRSYQPRTNNIGNNYILKQVK